VASWRLAHSLQKSQPVKGSFPMQIERSPFNLLLDYKAICIPKSSEVV
jgi:hypothetical protein